MNVLFLAAATSVHTMRWANALSDFGVKLTLVTQQQVTQPFADGIEIVELPYTGGAAYFMNGKALRKIVRQTKPDLLHAHYASGYGTTSRLAGFLPSLLSVWGSDVYLFPEKSPLHRWLLRRNLLAATRLASTSRAMTARVRELVPEAGEIATIPFGVELDRFSTARIYDRESITIGTVKGLKQEYGIDLLLHAFASTLAYMKASHPTLAPRLKLRIVGDGPDRVALEALASKLGVSGVTEFVGPVPHGNVPDEVGKIDIFVALSRSESFGVAVVEAQAGGCPVIVSNVGGLPEVMVDGQTGLLVPAEDAEAASNALNELILDPDRRAQAGQAGRLYVEQHYEWENNVAEMVRLYEEILKDKSARVGR